MFDLGAYDGCLVALAGGCVGCLRLVEVCVRFSAMVVCLLFCFDC